MELVVLFPVNVWWRRRRNSEARPTSEGCLFNEIKLLMSDSGIKSQNLISRVAICPKQKATHRDEMVWRDAKKKKKGFKVTSVSDSALSRRERHWLTSVNGQPGTGPDVVMYVSDPSHSPCTNPREDLIIASMIALDTPIGEKWHLPFFPGKLLICLEIFPT